MFKWLRRLYDAGDPYSTTGEPSLVAEQAIIAGEAMTVVRECIELINMHMPILLTERPRLSLWIDRTEKPYMLQLSDWSNSYPEIIVGER